jgi:Nitroreductase
MFEGERQSAYRALKLQGILEAPLGLCITCDRNRAGATVLGRTHQPEMDIYSAVCAVQNLWLAARAEGSASAGSASCSYQDLRAVLGIPETILPIAFLCLGYVSEFLPRRSWRAPDGASDCP